MKTEFVAIENAKGKWVLLTGVDGVQPEYCRITTTKDLNLLIEVRVSEHPALGHFSWTYPRGTLMELRPPVRPPAAAADDYPMFD